MAVVRHSALSKQSVSSIDMQSQQFTVNVRTDVPYLIQEQHFICSFSTSTNHKNSTRWKLIDKDGAILDQMEVSSVMNDN